MENFPNRKTVAKLREKYPEGCRVELVEMDDKYAPPVGTKGTVSFVDDTGSVFVDWDTAAVLLLCMGRINAREHRNVKSF